MVCPIGAASRVSGCRRGCAGRGWMCCRLRWWWCWRADWRLSGCALSFLRDELALIRPTGRRPAAAGHLPGRAADCPRTGRARLPRPGGGNRLARLTLTEAGRASPLAALDGALTSMLHWHGDTFDLPDGAVRLASTRLAPIRRLPWARIAWRFSVTRKWTARGWKPG